jgi:hypothetical protein
LAPGLYFYIATVTNDNSVKTLPAKKLVVIK